MNYIHCINTSFLVIFYGDILDSNYTFLAVSGYSLLRDPHHNKGLAFSEKERDAHYLRGLLPPTAVSQDLQVTLGLVNLHELSKHGYLYNYQFRAAKCNR